MLSTDDTPVQVSNLKKANHQAKQGAVLDGFTRRPQATENTPKAKPSQARTSPVTAKAHLQKSKTLMRPAVKKPKPVAPRADIQRVKHSIVKKQDIARAARAAQVQKSGAVNRYGAHIGSTGIQRHVVEHLPVVAAPSSVSQRVAQLATSTETQLKQSVDLIEESLRNASSHLEQFDSRSLRKSFLERTGFRNKAANIGAISTVTVLLFGFFAWQNAPNLQTRLAATQSGVSAHMPGYKPSGYSAQRGVKSEPGKVAITFRSNTDDKQFVVTQQASNWSSDSLLSNHVLASRQPFQTYQDQGKTVFIYDNSNATWVSGGVWYRIDGNASLTSDQLLRIASSF